MSKKLKQIFLILILGLSLALWPGHSRAATGSIYLTPSSTSVKSGSSFTVYLRINPGTDVDAAEATINFSSSKLKVVSATASTSAFSLVVQKIVASNYVTITEAKVGGYVNSDSLMASITFKALASSGSTSLTLSGANATYSGSYTNPTPIGASVHFSASSSGGGSSDGGSDGSSGDSSWSGDSSSSNTTKKVKPPKVTSELGDVDYTTADIKVSNNLKAESTVSYGLSDTKLTRSKRYAKPATQHTIKLNGLTPGTSYYYRVSSKNIGGTTKTAIETFKTKGYSLKVAVLDSGYKPLANQKVTLYSDPMTTTTDSKGIATFTEVPPGQHTLQYDQAGKNYKQYVYVANNVVTSGGVQTASQQTASVVLSSLSLLSATTNGAGNLKTTIYQLVIAMLAALLIILMSPLGPRLRTAILRKLHLEKST